MGDLLGKLIPLALGVAVSPIPLLAELIMLTTEKAVKNAMLLLVGWVGVMAAIGLGGLLILGDVELGGIAGSGGHVDDVANIVVGLVLLILAAVRYFQLRKGTARGQGVSRLLNFCDGMKPVSAIMLGVLTVVLNPKNILVTLSAVGLILTSEPGFGHSLVALAVFVALATSLLAAPVTLYLVAPHRSSSILSRWKKWLLEHNQEVIVYLLVVLGLLLAGTGLWGLLG
ncbi:MAG: GAP family protein [Actinobacteria bacterium]|nr:GAP family protein [Actinomycetota bacterium]MBU2687151.1 GAP family protein [Actinomycetota bacterium]